ncbi:hypothetical protein ACSVDA_15205 [Cytobacillus sp. Hm23]
MLIKVKKDVSVLILERKATINATTAVIYLSMVPLYEVLQVGGGLLYLI